MLLATLLPPLALQQDDMVDASSSFASLDRFADWPACRCNVRVSQRTTLGFVSFWSSTGIEMTASSLFFFPTCCAFFCLGKGWLNIEGLESCVKKRRFHMAFGVNFMATTTSPQIESGNPPLSWNSTSWWNGPQFTPAVTVVTTHWEIFGGNPQASLSFVLPEVWRRQRACARACGSKSPRMFFFWCLFVGPRNTWRLVKERMDPYFMIFYALICLPVFFCVCGMRGSGLNRGDGWKKGKIITVARVDSFWAKSGGGATVFINVSTFLSFSQLKITWSM